MRRRRGNVQRTSAILLWCDDNVPVFASLPIADTVPLVSWPGKLATKNMWRASIDTRGIFVAQSFNPEGKWRYWVYCLKQENDVPISVLHSIKNSKKEDH